MSDPILNQGEVIIRKEDAREYVGVERYSAWLYLTNQRIILNRMIGRSAAYPLSHITKAEIVNYKPISFALTGVNLLQISFDNGSAVRFNLSSDKSVWIRSIEQAKVNAPDLPYTTIPPEYTKSAPTSKFLWIAALIISLCLFASCTLILVALMLLRSHS
jgi:hypothetical protein